MFNFKILQEQQKYWVKSNFGNRPAWQPLCGVVEEYGEFMEAYTSGDKEAKIDALADIMIFISDYCTAQKWDLQTIWNSRPDPDLNSSVCDDVMLIGKIHHHNLKMEQNIRGSKKEHVEKIKIYLAQFISNIELEASHLDVNLISITEKVWQEVKKRDWKKDKKLKNRIIKFYENVKEISSGFLKLP
jgi:hypothetical protein